MYIKHFKLSRSEQLESASYFNFVIIKSRANQVFK